MLQQHGFPDSHQLACLWDDQCTTVLKCAVLCCSADDARSNTFTQSKHHPAREVSPAYAFQAPHCVHQFDELNAW
jgi:hypothetical protein